MDATRFDRLARTLTAAGTRRGMLLGILLVPPLLGGWAAPFDKADAKRRPQGRMADRGGDVSVEKKRKKRKRKCKPKSQTTTCAGNCGPVKNNCQKTIDCGSCACDPACGPCQACQGGAATPGTCVPAHQVETCGDRRICAAGACISCGFPGEPCCPGETCAQESYSCIAGMCEFCGLNSEPCCSDGTCARDETACINGICAFCGAPDELCCPGDTCNTGTCTEGVCPS